MPTFTLAEIKNPKLEGWNAPERFRKYALKVDGVVTGIERAGEPSILEGFPCR